ncbi:phosphatidylserine decarboxylase [Peribacillus saganii]|uniref:phosphatidylserine decarboxylase n=1 Tax=Peribacillus saganii TaxID=2303992 RepID=A0A372LTX8_9BACI|nr:phosphatidylserine decarboxylase [Peribacillus saganii]RFU71649.1 phosphatidylserine decarboxylase [Peribacillus saganii]
MLQTIYRILIELTNGRVTSEALKRFAQSRWSRPFISPFSRFYNINIGEIEGDLLQFATLHDLFTRRLKAGMRIVNDESHTVTSPVDGVLEDIGEITEEKHIVVKGKEYSIEEMLGDHEILQKYLGGTYMVLYLSPSHYHRIHAPVTGIVTKRWVLGQKSYPVNKLGMKYGRAPLSKNYRVLTEINHGNGHIAVVKVGAMFVNTIILTDESDGLEKGKEIAYFSFGSTVVLLYEKNTFTAVSERRMPSEVRVGEVLGYLKREQELNGKNGQSDGERYE